MSCSSPPALPSRLSLLEHELTQRLHSVLNPMNAMAEPNPTAKTQDPAFAGATPVREAPFTAGVTPTTTLMPAAMATGTENGAGGVFAAVPTAAIMAGGAAALLANM